jgi:sec-independent protein translocase protein TatA
MFGAPGIGAPELLIVLVIVLVLFGAGKLADVGGALGKGIREFRQGMDAPSEETPPPTEETKTG